MIPIEDLTDVTLVSDDTNRRLTLAIEDTDEDDEDDEMMMNMMKRTCLM